MIDLINTKVRNTGSALDVEVESTSALSWNSAFLIEIIDDLTILLLDEKECVVLEGRVYPHLVTLLDGKRGMEELEDILSETFFPPEVSFAVEIGIAKGVIVKTDNLKSQEEGFWNVLGIRDGTIKSTLSQSHVVVSSVGDVPSEGLIESLHRMGVETADSGDLQVVVVDDYLRPELEEINARALESGLPWMLVRPVGSVLWIGPLFQPGQTGCWACLAQRLSMNRLIEGYLQRYRSQDDPICTPTVAVPISVDLAMSTAALEVMKALFLGEESTLAGSVMTLDCLSLETQRHILTRRPQCSACGDQDYLPASSKPPVLKSCLKQSSDESGHRVNSPEETYDRYEDHISPITGIIRTLEAFGAEDDHGLTHSYISGHNFALSHMDLKFVLGNMRGRSGGKGVTEVQAKVSAMCEAIERYSGCFRGDEPIKKASYREISDRAFHPYSLMHFSEDQYDRREELNGSLESNFHRIPNRFDEDRVVDWTLAWSLTYAEFKYVPAAYTYFGHPELGEHSFCGSDSNGNAAGATLEEAIVQGFMELVERDAVSVFWYNKLRRPRVDLKSFNDSYINRLCAYFEEIERNLWVIDITHDLGIHTFVAVSSCSGRKAEDIIVGFGAHFDPRVALLRSLTEVNQFLPSVMMRDSNGETIYRFNEQEALSWWTKAKLVDHMYLVPDDSLPARKAEDMVDHSTGDLKTDIEKCVEIMREHGMETLIVDQTQPDAGINVVKVLAPGMRHMWKRFGQGRLFDVPVAMGWLDSPTPEDELNQTGVFF